MSTLTTYLESLQGKSIAVIGMGISNTPLVTLLSQAGLSVTVRDRAKREEVSERATSFEELGATLILGGDYLENLTEDVIFRTPGLSPNTPQLVAAREQGSVITSEMELFLAHCPCHTIGVTGSDGKTTTTTIIAELLKASGYRTFVGGNIGAPLLPLIHEMGPNDWAVLELSSFQLMGMPYSPEISVFTNVTPNHLDYHHTMEEYQMAKTNIFAHQKAGQRAVFNGDNAFTLSCAQQVEGATLFSRELELEEGVFLKNDALWISDEGGCRKLLPLTHILLPGIHNVENYMAAIAAVRGIVPVQCIRAVAATFGGVRHRIQLVRNLNGIRYYNDSIGSSPTRTQACLRAFQQPVVLIAGGYDKEVPFDQLAADIVNKVKVLTLTGVAAPKIRAAVESAPGYRENHPVILEESNFDRAVYLACSQAEEGDAVVLSPACASFDQFKNFAERGDRFCALVEGLGRGGETV